MTKEELEKYFTDELNKRIYDALYGHKINEKDLYIPEIDIDVMTKNEVKKLKESKGIA